MTETLVESEVVDGLAADQYHQHPALSSTGARRLLPPSTPARFRWLADHPEPPTREMELGTCVHTQVFGVGQGWAELPGDDLRVKATKEAAAEFAAAGLIALKPAEAATVRAIAAAVRAHPDAGPVLAEGVGTPERAIFWTDEATGVRCRALIDWSLNNGRAIVDLKTTKDAWPGTLPRTVANYGYHIQGAFYLRGARVLGLADESTEFVFVFAEKQEPHGVVVARLTREDLEWADGRVSRALEVYRDCSESGIWPGLPTGITTIHLPAWAKREDDDDLW